LHGLLEDRRAAVTLSGACKARASDCSSVRFAPQPTARSHAATAFRALRRPARRCRVRDTIPGRELPESKQPLHLSCAGRRLFFMRTWPGPYRRQRSSVEGPGNLPSAIFIRLPRMALIGASAGFRSRGRAESGVCHDNMHHVFSALFGMWHSTQWPPTDAGPLVRAAREPRNGIGCKRRSNGARLRRRSKPDAIVAGCTQWLGSHGSSADCINR